MRCDRVALSTLSPPAHATAPIQPDTARKTSTRYVLISVFVRVGVGFSACPPKTRAPAAAATRQHLVLREHGGVDPVGGRGVRPRPWTGENSDAARSNGPTDDPRRLTHGVALRDWMEQPPPPPPPPWPDVGHGEREQRTSSWSMLLGPTDRYTRGPFGTYDDRGPRWRPR